jgi:phage gp36-like protein
VSLSSNVQARYGAQLLRNLTNPQNSTATTLDTARLTAACNDVAGDFRIYCGVVYDDTDARHIGVGCECVITKLRLYSGQVKVEDVQKDYIARLKDLARVTGRDRIVIETNSTLSPSQEQNYNGSAPQPEFDIRDFDNYVPDRPGTSEPYVSP